MAETNKSNLKDLIDEIKEELENEYEIKDEDDDSVGEGGKGGGKSGGDVKPDRRDLFLWFLFPMGHPTASLTYKIVHARNLRFQAYYHPDKIETRDDDLASLLNSVHTTSPS